MRPVQQVTSETSFLPVAQCNRCGTEPAKPVMNGFRESNHGNRCGTSRVTSLQGRGLDYPGAAVSWNQSRTGRLVTGIAPVSRLDWTSVENKDDRLPWLGTLWKNKVGGAGRCAPRWQWVVVLLSQGEQPSHHAELSSLQSAAIRAVFLSEPRCASP